MALVGNGRIRTIRLASLVHQFVDTHQTPRTPHRTGCARKIEHPMYVGVFGVCTHFCVGCSDRARVCLASQPAATARASTRARVWRADAARAHARAIVFRSPQRLRFVSGPAPGPPGARTLKPCSSALCGCRRGTNVVSTNGVTANFMLFDIGTFGVFPLTYVYLPKGARCTVFPPICQKSLLLQRLH